MNAQHGAEYGGWFIQSEPESIAGGWCAVVEVWRSDDPNRRGKTVLYTPLFDTAGEAFAAGVNAGEQWINAH